MVDVHEPIDLAARAAEEHVAKRAHGVENGRDDIVLDRREAVALLRKQETGVTVTRGTASRLASRGGGDTLLENTFGEVHV